MVRRLVFAALAALLALPALALLAQPVLAQSNDPSFRVVNNTPDVVNEVYASPANQRSWGHDRLGTEVIRAGASQIIRLPIDGNCVYDIRVVFQGGRAEERRGVNTCNLTDFVLGGAAPPQQAQPRGGQQANPSFNLVNRSGRVIEEFYASPASQGSWGPDRLGEEIVQPGASFAVRLPIGECNYDLRVVWAGGQSQERRGVNTCAIADYVVR